MAIQIGLKEARKKKKLSQNGLAGKLDMTVQNIQRIEAGRAKSIPIDTLDKICEVLDCTPGDILIYQPKKAIAT